MTGAFFQPWGKKTALLTHPISASLLGTWALSGLVRGLFQSNLRDYSALFLDNIYLGILQSILCSIEDSTIGLCPKSA
jgi:hypothetical protein